MTQEESTRKLWLKEHSNRLAMMHSIAFLHFEEDELGKKPIQCWSSWLPAVNEEMRIHKSSPTDRTFHNLSASKSVNRRILCCSNSLIKGAWGSEMLKCSAGKRKWKCTCSNDDDFELISSKKRETEKNKACLDSELSACSKYYYYM